MPDHSLHDIYSRVQPNYKHVYVVPLIRFDFPATDYLYLLYKSFIDSDLKIKVHSTSAVSHWKFVIAQLLSKKPILHYHWLEFQDFKSLIGMVYKLKLIWLYKILGGKLVWTVHNLMPHDGKWIRIHEKIHRWMAQQSDTILVHSPSIIPDISKLYGVSEDKISVVPHPIFPTKIIQKTEAIKSLNKTFDLTLNSDDLIFGSLGAISNYKNLVSTIELLKEVGYSGKFLIFGYLKKDQRNLNRRLIEMSEEIEWLEYHPGFVAEKDISAIMCSFDYCLFNFKEISTSGSVELARSYDRQIIAPSKGILKDLIGIEKVLLFSSQKELKSIIKSIMAT